MRISLEHSHLDNSLAACPIESTSHTLAPVTNTSHAAEGATNWLIFAPGNWTLKCNSVEAATADFPCMNTITE